MANKRVTIKATLEDYLVARNVAGTSLSVVANEAIERWRVCEREAKQSLQGVFSNEELKALLGLVEIDYSCDPSSPRDFIKAFTIACEYEGLLDAYDIDQEEMTMKLEDLSPVQLLVLWDWEIIYWRLMASNQNVDTNEYIKKIG